MREPPESRGKPLWIPPPQVRTETLLSHPPPPATGPVENAVETCVQEGNDNPVIRAMGRALFGGFDLDRDDGVDVGEQVHPHLVDPDASDGLVQVDVVAVHLHPGLSLEDRKSVV